MKRKGYNLEHAVDLILWHWLKKTDVVEEDMYRRMLHETGATDGKEELDEVIGAVGVRDMKAKRRREQAYEAFLQATRRTDCRRTDRRRWGWWWSAAVVVLLFGVGSMLLTMKEKQVVPVAEEVIVAQAKAYLTLSDGSQVDVSTLKQDERLGREGIVACDSGMLTYIVEVSEKEAEIAYNTINVPRGGDFRLVLGDGTHIFVNAESELRYPVNFDSKSRDVYVSGEAYFKVAHDASRPFRVHTSRGVIEVLGTEFNVRDYEDEKAVKTTLAEGSVVYRTEGKGRKQQTMYLKPGYQVVDDGGRLEKRQVDVGMVASWKDGKYTFYDKTLEELMEYVERTYNVEVFFMNESVKKLRFSGDLQRYDRVGLFLTYLEQGGDVRFSVQGRTITVYRK